MATLPEAAPIPMVAGILKTDRYEVVVYVVKPCLVFNAVASGPEADRDDVRP